MISKNGPGDRPNSPRCPSGPKKIKIRPNRVQKNDLGVSGGRERSKLRCRSIGSIPGQRKTHLKKSKMCKNVENVEDTWFPYFSYSPVWSLVRLFSLFGVTRCGYCILWKLSNVGDKGYLWLVPCPWSLVPGPWSHDDDVFSKNKKCRNGFVRRAIELIPGPIDIIFSGGAV